MRTNLSTMRQQKTSIFDFQFFPSGFGHYKVTYTSPVTNKKWTKTISDMCLIDLTKNADNPKQTDLNKLKNS